MLFAGVYKATELVTNVLGIDDPVRRGEVFNVAPRLAQAGFAAGGDFYTWRLGVKVLGDEGGWTAVSIPFLVVVVKAKTDGGGGVAAVESGECVPLVLLDSDV